MTAHPDIAINRSEAIRLNLTKYYGIPCQYGHEPIRYASGRTCVGCRAGTPEGKARNILSQKRWRAVDPRRMLFSNAKNRAKRLNLNFNLSIEDVIIPELCPVLGTPMESPSIDRVDSTRGYTKDNIRVISWRANKLKSDATFNELRQLVAYVKSHQSSTSKYSSDSIK